MSPSKNNCLVVNGDKISRRLMTGAKALARVQRSKRLCLVSFLTTPESETFMAKKILWAKMLGVEAWVERINTNSEREARLELKEILSGALDGLVIQLPIAQGLNLDRLQELVPRELDVDMLGKEAHQAYMKGETDRVPPVARAVHEILAEGRVNLRKRKVVVLGKGRLVGQPIAMYLEKQGVEFEIFDKNSSKEALLKSLKRAGVVITGIGSPHFIKPEMVKEGVVLIDAGTSEQAGVLAGDVDPACAKKAGLYTPVPGGVGPITVAGLLANLFVE